MSLCTVWGSAVSEDWASGVCLVCILLVGNWARVTTPGRHKFSTYYCYHRLSPGFCSVCCPGLSE